jgi:hypothetical protein
VVAARVDQPIDPFPDEELAAFAVAGDRLVVTRRAPAGDLGLSRTELLDQRPHRTLVLPGVVCGRVETGSQDPHLSRPGCRGFDGQ